MITLIIGIMGMIFILSSFVLEEFSKKTVRDTFRYNIFNLIGAGALTYYAVMIQSWPFLILNLVWLAAAAIKLTRIIIKKPINK